MANKALFHLVTFKDGHRTWQEVIASQSKASLMTASRSPHVSMVVEKSLGWHTVKAVPSDTDDVMFQAEVGGRELTVERMHSGHGYLTQQFPDQVQAVLAFVAGNDGN